VAELCEKTGANVVHVAKAMGKDGRIGPKFLHPGPGYGGSCFPKDTRAFAFAGREFGSPMTIIEDVIKFNDRHILSMADTIDRKMGGVKGATIGVLGLAFKPNTDDMREAPALFILRRLIDKGAVIRAYDPAAMDETRGKYFKDEKKITYHANEYEAVSGADAMVILTEWNQFRNLNLDKIKSVMTGKFFFDLRNVYQRKQAEEKGFAYTGVGT
jgi:UDPglucose 6-dehydrogenase